MKILILDDMILRHDTFNSIFKSPNFELVNVYNVNQAVKALKESEFDFIFLDHDLGENTPDGRYFANWISNQEKKFKGKIIIHSFNPIGAKNMFDILTAVGYDVLIENFPCISECENIKKYVAFNNSTNYIRI